MTPFGYTVTNWAYEGPNEDAFAVSDDATAGAVFDGLAGHPGSWHAAAAAAAATEAAFADRPDPRWAWHTAHQARAAVLHARRDHPEFPKMTCAAAFAQVTGDTLEVSWCGDVRVYRLHGHGLLARITDDHDLIYEQVLHDRISPQKAAAARAALDEADSQSDAWRLGGGLAKKAFRKSHQMFTEMAAGMIDLLTMPWDDESAVVICSDGVHGNLLRSQMQQIAGSVPVDQLAQALVQASRDRALAGEGRAHPDDITCVVLPPRSFGR
jgi:serine/threonine protein phosphatase PrpC